MTPRPHAIVAAGRIRRAFARLVDLIIVIATSWLLMAAVIHPMFFAESLDDPEANTGLATVAVFYLLLVTLASAYEVVFVAWRGATPGKMLFGLEIVELSTGERPRFTATLVRWAMPAVSFIVPVAGPVLPLLICGSALVSHDRRGWYDHAAGTVAIRTSSATEPA